MTEPTQAPKPPVRAPEVAVAPLNTIAEQDVGAAAAAFDKWLRKISYGYVTLERLSTVAGSLPVIGNIIALIDAIMDVVWVIQKYTSKKEIDFLAWVSLGINLIGVVPVPPAMSAARMSLRPALHLVRQKLALGVKDLGAALIEVLIMHLNARLAGEIDTFVDSAMAKLSGILDDCAHLADGMADDLIRILKRCIGKEPLFEVASPAQVERKLHDPKVTSSWRRMLGALDRQCKKAANYAAAAAASHLPQSAVAGVTGHYQAPDRLQAGISRQARRPGRRKGADEHPVATDAAAPRGHQAQAAVPGAGSVKQGRAPQEEQARPRTGRHRPAKPGHGRRQCLQAVPRTRRHRALNQLRDRRRNLHPYLDFVLDAPLPDRMEPNLPQPADRL